MSKPAENKVQDGAEEAGQGIGEAISNAANYVAETAVAAAEAIGLKEKPPGEKLKDGLAEAGEGISDAAKKGAEAAGLKEKEPQTKVREGAEEVGSGMADAASNAAEAVTESQRWSKGSETRGERGRR